MSITNQNCKLSIPSKYKIAFATGSRADYGIVRNYISRLNADHEIDFSILATGALLSENFGNAIKIIEDDGFRIDFKNNVEQRVARIDDTVRNMAEVLSAFNDFFSKKKYDLLIILGDRYEIYSVAIAAAMHHIPILHIHGGEITLANYDEFIRHSITKMAQFHITSTEEYRQRVIQLGEQPSAVFNLGALGAENCLHIDLNNVPNELLGINNIFTVLFHPETLNAEAPSIQIDEILRALSKYTSNYKFAFIGSNADTHSDQIIEKVSDFCQRYNGCLFFKNLHPDAYHYLVKNSIALIGNSSSGILEAPSLGTYTINIGDRQTGRAKGSSIIDTRCNTMAISKAIDWVITHKDDKITDNIYYQPNSAERYYQTTKQIINRLPELGFKTFFDLKNHHN